LYIKSKRKNKEFEKSLSISNISRSSEELLDENLEEKNNEQEENDNIFI